ncbi:MAG: carbohydrate ABC transporter permease [Thermobacillus sp.]|uniref:ABC-type sugar transport system, permease component n=2 Tax=Thermobacillus TaxID=76632 RepID=L0EJL8_THECK|nr:MULTISPECIES: carbohydrate ABC transporter permease [Thermobacillus]AGA59405.1 ABC-type sugar transport system, permease component [Thermobacillus composti KWC4]REK58411.1 MAG: carbohydrate ABC transporter permease [Thermobacillus sp.]CAG5082572.1 Binding-protein-dependent transport systems inner membrane component [Thermobacillus xylanilyticus]
MSRKGRLLTIEIVSVALSIILFWVPLYFVILTALKNPQEAARMNLDWPTEIRLWQNIKEVFVFRDYMLVRAFWNSTLLTVLSIVVLTVVSSMAAFVMQRRQDKASPWISFFVLAGLIIPPAVVPTIWVLNGLGLFKTMTGLVLVEVALGFPFCVMLYRGFMGTIPKDIDEAAVVDGYGGYRLFFQIIFPLLKPVTSTIIVTQAVVIFNDFVNPLYFLPGSKNVTLQLTLYNFTSQFISKWNLLFTDILLITIPPLILFIFFNKRIVAGMVAGSVKG